ARARRRRPAEGAGAAARAGSGEAAGIGEIGKIESRELRLALGIDLAAIEARPLVLVRKQVVGRAHFREALLRLRIIRILVGVIALGKPAERPLDLRLTRRAAHLEHVIGVAHEPWLRRFDKVDVTGTRNCGPFRYGRSGGKRPDPGVSRPPRARTRRRSGTGG